ncbi:hypothetical protein IT418_04205 [bacterium]|nr:hypothetical protein [bacterium]
MLRNTLRLLSVLLLSIVFVSRFGFTDLLASEISSIALVELANKDRQEKELPPLKYNKKLERAAFLKAENMFKEQYWAHYGPNKESPWQFILESGYTYAYAGENLAKGFSDSQSVHDAWMASPTHRANILDGQFQEVGIATVKGRLLGSEVFLVVQMFGSPTYRPPETRPITPTLKIDYPKDGDILEDGITNIRGETKGLTDPMVTLYLNNALLGSAQSEDSKFSLESPLTAAEGDQMITAKVASNDEIYLTDSVVVTVVNKDTGAVGISKTCIQSKKTALAIELHYDCQRENTTFTATVGTTKYMQNRNVRDISIPLSSLPRENATVILSLTFADGTSTAFMSTLSELGRTTESTTIAGTTENTYRLPSLQIREWIFGLFGLTFVLLLLYAGQLAYKKQLLLHRYELLSFMFFLGILLIAFNFGYIRV